MFLLAFSRTINVIKQFAHVRRDEQNSYCVPHVHQGYLTDAQRTCRKEIRGFLEGETSPVHSYLPLSRDRFRVSAFDRAGPSLFLMAVSYRPRSSVFEKDKCSARYTDFVYFSSCSPVRFSVPLNLKKDIIGREVLLTLNRNVPFPFCE